MFNDSLFVARHPHSGEPFMFTFDGQKAWNQIFEITASMCDPDDIFDRTLADVEQYSGWDEMKMVMGEYLSPEQNEELYNKRSVYL